MKVAILDREIVTSAVDGPSGAGDRGMPRGEELQASAAARKLPRALLAALGLGDARRFLEQHWERAPLVGRRRPGAFRALFSVPLADQLLATRRLAWRNVQISYGSAEHPLASYDQVPDLGSASIAMSSVEEVSPPLRRLLALAERGLGRPTSALCFVHPAGWQSALRWDRDDGIVLSTSGVQRWRVYEPLVALSLDGRQASGEEVEGHRPVVDVVLEEGTALYVPRGFVHRALTQSGHSAHVLLALRPVTIHDVVAESWRRSLHDARHDRGAGAMLRQRVQIGAGPEESRLAEELTDRLSVAARRADHARIAEDQALLPPSRALTRGAYQPGNVLMYRAALGRPLGRAHASYTAVGHRYVTRDTEVGTTLVFASRSVTIAKGDARELAHILARRSFSPAERVEGVRVARLTRLADELTNAGFLSRRIRWEAR